MKVLVAIDSSPASQRVLDEVGTRPWPPNTSFCIAMAVDVGPYVALPALIEAAKRECEQILKAGARLLAQTKLVAMIEVLVGSPRKVISEYAAEWGADLIFAGSHGHSAIGRFLLGSTAQGILRSAKCSVEIVRFEPGGRTPSSHPMKILLATDGSDFSIGATRFVAAQPWPAGTICRVMSVEELVTVPIPMEASSLASIYPTSLLDELLTASRARAVDAIEGSRKILQQAALRVLDQIPIATGDARSVILDSARAWPADLIVLGSHGRRGLDRFFMGSVAENVAVHAHCSVAVIRQRHDAKE